MIKAFVISTLSGLFVTLLIAVIRYRQCLMPSLQCMLLYRNKELRVSMAAILKISREERYLLIRNYHRPELFSPIGGVYKFYPSGHNELDRYNFRQQTRGRDQIDDMKSDLRGFISGKYFPSFIRWFNSGKNREVEPLTRELIEELREIGLDREAESIQTLQYELIRTIHEGPHIVPGVSYIQFRYFEVYQFNSDDPNAEKITDILFSQAKDNPNLIMVTAEEITKRRADSGELIGTHTGYLIGEKRTGPEPAPFA